jgi:hypothetical protein
MVHKGGCSCQHTSLHIFFDEHFGFLLSYWFSCIISNIMAFKGQVREVEYCLYLIGYILSHYGFNIF